MKLLLTTRPKVRGALFFMMGEVAGFSACPSVRTKASAIGRHTQRVRNSRTCSTQIAAQDKAFSINNQKEKEIEVERKFSLENGAKVQEIEERLELELGYECTGRVSFVDWYYDTVQGDPCHTPWQLSTNDIWLRYRQYLTTEDQGEMVQDVTRGSWQLKRRPQSFNRDSGKIEAATTTVYEELEGQSAIDVALANIFLTDEQPTSCTSFPDNKREALLHVSPSILSSHAQTSTSTVEYPYPMHELPAGCGLVPFARFQTNRSSWTTRTRSRSAGGENNQTRDSTIGNYDKTLQHIPLQVDLDGTDFGYQVGEVEAIVSNDNEGDINNALRCIDAFMEKLLVGNGDASSKSGPPPPPSLGKLETYLAINCPEHYEACFKR
jgi:thiamine-triphosphatase